MYRGKPIRSKNSSAASTGAPVSDRVKAALRKLKELREAGLISNEEYERKKSDLLDLL